MRSLGLISILILLNACGQGTGNKEALCHELRLETKQSSVPMPKVFECKQYGYVWYVDEQGTILKETVQ